MAEFLRVTEIFHSIQGESTWAGLPCTFVRLTGCPLRCVWCDTEYSFHGGDKVMLYEVSASAEATRSAVPETSTDMLPAVTPSFGDSRVSTVST